MTTRFLRILLPSGIALALVACGGRGLENPGPGPISQPRSCTDEGKVHASGTSWTCSDGCNTCSCDDGTIASTLLACEPPPPPACTVLAPDGGVTTYPSGTSWPGGSCGGQCSCNAGVVECPDELCVPPCVENGVSHVPGDIWTCADGCNRCTCEPNGQYSVTPLVCDDGGGPPPARDGGIDASDGGDTSDSAVPGQCGPAQHLCGCMGGSFCLAAGAACPAPTAACPCTTADDCVGGLPAICAICDDGGEGCAHFVCAGGACQTAFCE